MGGDADGAFQSVSRARMVMRNQCCRWTERQQQAQQRYLFRDRPHDRFL